MKHLAAVSTIAGVILAVTLLAVHCSGQPGVGVVDVGTEPGQRQSARSALDLPAGVATDTAPSGPTAGELLTIEDVGEILGRDGIFFLTCGG